MSRRSKVNCTFGADQRTQQTEYFRLHHEHHIGVGRNASQLKGDIWRNIAPDYARTAKAMVQAKPRISSHRYANHALSSQMCCLNFLLPLAKSPALVARWLEPIMGLTGIEVLPIESRAGAAWFIAFEWFPPEDYLHEATPKGRRSRGHGCTSVDAAIRFRHGGREQLVLIEWKYTESYGDTRSQRHRAGDPTRDRRYSNIWKRPHGPIRSDAALSLQDFYLDPWFQLLRQQMMAYHVEADPLSGIDRATVLHLSPRGNRALKRVNGDAFGGLAGETIFDLFSGLLAPELRDRFKAVHIEDAFAAQRGWDDAPWHPWLADRYPTLCPA